MINKRKAELLAPAGSFDSLKAAVAAGAFLIYKNWDRISPLLGKTAARFESFWNTVQPQLQPFLGLCTEIGSYLESGFIKAVQFVFSEGSDVIVIFFEGASQYQLHSDEIVFDYIILHIHGFLGVLEGVTTFMNGVFTGNWEKAWKGLRDIVSNSFGMLEALVKTPMNAVISIVNGAISRINSIHFTVPDWVLGIGGKAGKGLTFRRFQLCQKEPITGRAVLYRSVRRAERSLTCQEVQGYIHMMNLSEWHVPRIKVQ